MQRQDKFYVNKHKKFGRVGSWWQSNRTLFYSLVEKYLLCFDKLNVSFFAERIYFSNVYLIPKIYYVFQEFGQA